MFCYRYVNLPIILFYVTNTYLYMITDPLTLLEQLSQQEDLDLTPRPRLVLQVIRLLPGEPPKKQLHILSDFNGIETNIIQSIMRIVDIYQIALL